VGQFYEDFTQVSDEEVRALLEEFWRAPEGRGGP
ncbi:MAG: phosphoribosyltransferase, partial [candidate division GAL15 bacterium]